MSTYTDARDAFRDHFSNLLNEDGRLAEGAELPRYWQEDMSDLADGLVPAYTSDLIAAWTDAGYPEVDDPGLVEGVTDITKIIGVALYETYNADLYQIALDAGFED